MTASQVSANDIAELQLQRALECWFEGDHLSAITLAGAAEEILGKRLRKLNQVPSLYSFIDGVLKLYEKNGMQLKAQLRKSVRDSFNEARNTLKHYAGDEELSIDLLSESNEMLTRAIYNYQV